MEPAGRIRVDAEAPPRDPLGGLVVSAVFAVRGSSADFD
jgi:hypothetical protein